VPSVYDLKPRFQLLLRPVVGWLASSGVTANHVTVGAMVMSLAVGGVIAVWPQRGWLLLLLPVTLLVRMALNAVDGMLAREHGMKSRLGAVLNELGDVVSDVALYLPVARVSGVDPGWVSVVVVLAMMTEMAGVVALQVGSDRRYEGPMGKSDRAFAFGVLGAVLGCGVAGGFWVTVYLGLIAGLCLWTVTRRCTSALREGGAR
jgi:CDP-diacylglycerol--glycerol-3-phosphate 3-phosphatidyltransferase